MTEPHVSEGEHKGRVLELRQVTRRKHGGPQSERTGGPAP